MPSIAAIDVGRPSARLGLDARSSHFLHLYISGHNRTELTGKPQLCSSGFPNFPTQFRRRPSVNLNDNNVRNHLDLIEERCTNVITLAAPMAQRVTLRKRQPYNTTSNRRRVVKTPGGKLVVHHLKKPATQPKCGDCGIALPGVCLIHSFNVEFFLMAN
jgi:hypothetical protein